MEQRKQTNLAQLSNEYRENEEAVDRAEWKFDYGKSGDSGASDDSDASGDSGESYDHIMIIIL